MRRLLTLALALPVAVALNGGYSFAGGAECAEKAAAAANVAQHKKCSVSKEECQHMMAEAKSRGWLGLELDQKEADGAWTITKVVPGSPAAQADFREGDVLLALNGVTLGEKQNYDKLAAIKKNLKPGDSVTYNVRRNGTEQNLTARLGVMPEEIYTAWINEHMKEHTEVAAR